MLRNRKKSWSGNLLACDDLMNVIPLDEYAATKHVYAIPIDGNKAGIGGYIDKIVAQILKQVPKTFKVFCYGSNMSSKRILDRCSTATFKEVVKVDGYKFSFNKKSTDGSGKGNMNASKLKTDFVLGVIFEIEESQRKALEDAEGLGKGYEEIKLDLTNETGKKVECIAYIATEAKFIDNKLVPYDWYKEHCLIGAREYNLPDEYVEMIEAIASGVDTDTARAEKERNIYN